MPSDDKSSSEHLTLMSYMQQVKNKWIIHNLYKLFILPLIMKQLVSLLKLTLIEKQPRMCYISNNGKWGNKQNVTIAFAVLSNWVG